MANPFWPSVDTMDEAKKACHSAAGFSFFVAIVTAVVVWVQTSGKMKIIEGFDQWAYLDAALFFLIGLGLLWCSRIAALIGLVLYILERAMMMKQVGMQPSNIFLPLIVTLGFVGGVRGAFAYHVFKKEARAEEASQPASILPDSQVSEEESPGKKRRKIFLKIALYAFILAAVLFIIFGAIAYFAGASKKSSGTYPEGVMSSEAVTSSQEVSSVPSSAQTANYGQERVFHLKDGSTIKGKIVREDEIYYTVETFGGSQQYVIKEDIAKEG